MTAIPCKIFRVCHGAADLQARICRYQILCCSIIDFVEFEDNKIIKINSARTDCDLLTLLGLFLLLTVEHTRF